MNAWLCVLGFAMAASSAVALYAASPHCMWRALRGRPRIACAAGIVLALLSLLIWAGVLGIDVGVCSMLVSWMLALAAQPYVALFTGTPTADVTSTERN